MSMAERLGSSSEAWRPKDNEDHPNPLMGTVVEVDVVEGTAYGSYPLLYILDENGEEWCWHVFGTVAQKRIGQLEPKVGDKIGAKYLGEEPSPNYPGKTYSDWKIIVERADGKPDGPDWDSVVKKAEAEEEEEF